MTVPILPYTRLYQLALTSNIFAHKNKHARTYVSYFFSACYDRTHNSGGMEKVFFATTIIHSHSFSTQWVILNLYKYYITYNTNYIMLSNKVLQC